MKECLACHKKIGMFRRLAHQRFCCQEHEETFWAELQKLAVIRLHDAAGNPSLDLDETAVTSELIPSSQEQELLTPVAVGS